MSISPDAGGDQNLLKIAAARVIACERMPYLSTAIFSMVPVKVEGLGTFASDAKWRLYWDPAKTAEWDVQKLAGVLLHEVGHCLRGHADRFTALNEPHQRHMIFNIAGDALINVDLRDQNIPLPDGAVYVENLPGAGREMSAEQIYRLLIEKALESCTCADKGQKSDGDSNDASDANSGDGEGQESGEQQGDGSGSESGEQQGNGGGQQPGSGDGEQQGNGSGCGHDHADEQGQGSGTDPNCPVHGNHGIPEGWDCGSAADGIKRDYEKEGDKVDAGVDSDRADLIRQKVAVEIAQHSKNRGDVPAGLERWAKELLDPVVDWRRELSSIVRRTFASVAGLRDYTYRRPSRRQAAMKATGQGVLLPAMRQPQPPQVAIVIDTSGSMSDEMLSWALTETQGVLRSLGSSERTVRVFSCDAQSGSAQRIRRASDINLTGGGGTDMRVGIEAAMQSQPAPDAVVVISDGYTPWPQEPLRNATLIVALTDEGAMRDVPEFARKVLVTR